MDLYIPGISHPPVDKNNNYIDPQTGETIHILTVDEMPCHSQALYSCSHSPNAETHTVTMEEFLHPESFYFIKQRS